MRLYLDTSVIGALFDAEMPERVQASRSLLDGIKKGTHVAFISNIVLEEIERGPADLRERILAEIREISLRVISEDESSADLVEVYEKEHFIRQQARMDLRHLAIATVQGVDAVVSWNFRDMVNVPTRRAVHSINLRLGLPLIEIVSPPEVIHYEE